jgi:activator of HSP90 ATPase
MVLHNPNNWHWVNKDVSPWAKDWLKKELIGLEVEEDGVTAKVDDVLSMDGDVDVSQRKGKVITLFDVKLKLEFSGKGYPYSIPKGFILIVRRQNKRRLNCLWLHHNTRGRTRHGRKRVCGMCF